MLVAALRHLGWAWLLGLLGLAGAAPVLADVGADTPSIAIIIDDLGDNWTLAKRSIDLPGPVTYSILPHTPYARRIALQVHQSGREVMLHQPMEAIDGKALGPGGLTLHMTHEEFVRTLLDNLDSLPYVQGVNNHMGSLLTRHPGHMTWLMEVLQARGGLYFVDSRTSRKTVADNMARKVGLERAGRDVFLDNDRSPDIIRMQFARGLDKARSNGVAILIGHPYPETLETLAELLPALKDEGVRLLPVSQLISYRKERNIRLWQASLSHSQKDSKSSKP